MVVPVIPCSFPQEGCRGPASCTRTDTQTPENDIVFVVGPHDNEWSIPGNKEILVQANPVLAQIIISSRGKSTISVPNVNPIGFKNFIGFLSGEEIDCSSAKSARTTLDVACKFACSCLVQFCIKHLDLNLNDGNVLQVFKGLYEYGHVHLNFEPSAPPLNTPPEDGNQVSIKKYCTALHHNCLHLIDAHASIILKSDDLDELDFHDISTIVRRKSLQLDSEMILFDAMLRWSKNECMRRGFMLSPDKCKEILGDLLLHVRYGLMTVDEFSQGPGKRAVLHADLQSKILNYLHNPSKFKLDESLRYMCEKREPNGCKPIYLSARSRPTEDDKHIKGSKKKIKKEPSKGLLNCLSVILYIFD